MARRIKRFLVFMFFSLFFTTSSKKVQTTDGSVAANNSVHGIAGKLGGFLPKGINSARADMECSISCGAGNGNLMEVSIYCSGTCD
ncbi:MAG: hypothetical protein IKS41_00245 [Alphaproteobacteria bacterium]|nr:hypothetical protein [Alphaproteobacteria bacterium]